MGVVSEGGRERWGRDVTGEKRRGGGEEKVRRKGEESIGNEIEGRLEGRER